jgi:hypothetical protein
MMDEKTIEGIRRVDPADRETLKKAAAWLRRQLGFGQMDCYRALFGSDGDLATAAEHLATGAWMRSKLISWDWEGLHEKTTQMSMLSGLPESACLPLLKNCNGNLDLAMRKLAGQPALTALPQSLE